MSENKLKEQIIEELKKAKAAGQLTTEKVHDIVREAVSAAVSETDGSYQELRPVVKEAVAAAVEGLTEAGVDPKQTVEGAIAGAIAGACDSGDQAVEATREEIRQLEIRLEDETARLAQSLREGLEGIQEAGAALSEDVRKCVEDTVGNVILNSTELLGLTRQTVKEAVKQTIESGKDVKEIVTLIAGDATEKALKEGRFSADRVKQIAEKVLSGAVEAAEETGKEVKEVAAGAFEGAQKGIMSAIESVENRTKSFLGEDLAQTKEDPVFIDDLFIEITRKVAMRSGEKAMRTLNDLADQAGKTTSVLREKAHSATETVAERLKQTGKDTLKVTTGAAGKAADVMSEEAKELGKRSVSVAKAAIAGMWQGTRDAFKKGDKGALMLKSDSFSHLEETLKDSQELMTKIIEKNVKWPGGGVFEEDINTARNLLKEMQTQFYKVGMAAYQSTSVEVAKSVNDRINQAHHLLSLIHQDIKKIRLSLKTGESQSKALVDLQVHLKKFIKHCNETQSWLLEAGKLDEANII